MSEQRAASAAAPTAPVKLVMFADLHLERQFSWASPAAASRRRLGLRQTLTNIVELAVREDADAILCGGDLYEDEFFSPDLMHVVASTLDCGIPVLVSPGNHDHFGPSSLYQRASLPSNVQVFDQSALTPVELTAGVQIWGAAHTAPSGTLGFFDQFQRGGSNGGPLGSASDVNLALFHGSERAGFAFEGEDKHPHAPFDAAQIPAAGFDFAFVGHHHRAVSHDHYCYPGNPDPLEFGEDGSRGAVLASISAGGAVAISREEVRATEAHSITIDVTGCAHSAAVHDLVRSALASCSGFVRADLTGELDPDVELDGHQLHDLGRDLEAFVVRTSGVRRSYSFDDIAMEEASVRAQFVQLVRGVSDMSEQDQQLVLELGLRAFDNRRDLEVL